MKSSEVRSRSQERGESGAGLSAEARRLLLGSMLRVFIRRCIYHKPILQADLRELAAFADDAGGKAGAAA
jgi:hypothetical protein